MKKLFKILIVIVILLIGALIITPFFFKDKIVSVVKEEINNNVNAKVDFKNVGLSLIPNFPNFTFTMDDLSVVGVDKFANDTLFASQEIALTIDLSSVLSGNYKVTKILLDNSVVNLLVLKDESANWDIAKESEADNIDEIDTSDSNTEGATAFQMTLESFEIRNANIVYFDKAANMSSQINNLNLELSGGLTANNTDFNIKSTIDQLTYKMDNIAYLNKANIDFDAKLLTDLDSMKFTFKDNAL